MQPASEKILVIKLGALGDFAQALGPMAAIRRHHPDAHITLMTTKLFESFANDCGYFDHVWVHIKPKWNQFSEWRTLRKDLNSAGYARIYDLQNNDRTSIYYRLFSRSNKPEWVGTAFGASHRNISKQRTTGHAFDGHKQTLALAGINDILIDPMEWVNADVEKFGLKIPYVLLVPGSSPQHPLKRWPARYYTQLAQYIVDENMQPVILGTDIEASLAAEIQKTVPEAVNLAGQTSLYDIIVLGRNAHATIGNDSGPMHLIAPTNCPCTVLYSMNSDPVRHRPLGQNVITLQKDNLSDLQVDEVIKAAFQQIDIPHSVQM